MAARDYNPAVISSALRLRCIALLLALLSPGAAGTVLSVLSACPVHSSALAARAAAEAPIGGTAAAHRHHAPSHSDSHHQCHCPGECCPGATAAAPRGPAAIAALPARVQLRLSLPSLARPERPSPRYVLPPSTAPPARA